MFKILAAWWKSGFDPGGLWSAKKYMRREKADQFAIIAPQLLLGRQPRVPPVMALVCTRKTNARREGNMSFHLSAAGRKAGKDQPVFLLLRVILGVEL